MKRSVLALPTMIHAKRYAHSIVAPVCMTCGRYLDGEELVEGEEGKTTYAKVLAKHHGAEELRTFEFFSSNWDSEDLRKFISSADWFDPRVHDGGVNIVRGDS